MQFKKGFKIKPKYIASTGDVIFTDGTNDVIPNQLSCESYGYVYNDTTGTCTAFKYNTKINTTSDNVHNIIKGNLNTTNTGTENSFLLGSNNTLRGNNLNSLVSGKNNEIENNLNNSAIIAGSFGQSNNHGEVVLAGGGFGQALGMAQTSFIQQSGTTTDATETLLTTQNLNSTHILKVANAVIGFEANVIGVDISTGSTFDYGYVQVTGAVKFYNSLESGYFQSTTHVVQPGHSGMNISAQMKDAEAISFSVAVTGIEDKTIQWTADVKLWQNKTLKSF